jgi:hypothetical protein
MPLKPYGEKTTRAQRLLFTWLYKRNAHNGKGAVQRAEVPEGLQPHVDQLLILGIVEKYYDKFTTYTGRQKICYLKLICARTLDSKDQPLPVVRQGPKKKAKNKPKPQPIVAPVARKQADVGCNNFRYPDEATRLAEQRLRERQQVYLQ